MPILHLVSTLPALIPRYVTRFQCSGAACEDTCCNGWPITIDRKTYEAYRQGADPELAEAVEAFAEPPHELLHGQLRSKPGTQECRLLTAGMCGVHATLGESHLSHTCFVYPRVVTDFGGQIEQALELSCPEAARAALLADDAFEFEEAPVTTRAAIIKRVRASAGFEPELMHELRIFCLNLMRLDGLELWQRLALLGVFCESASAPLAARDNAALRAVLANFGAVVGDGQLLDALAVLQPDHGAQALVFSTLWAGKGFASASATEREVIAVVAAGLGAEPETGHVTAERLITHYKAGVQRLPEALHAAPRLLEHYLLNELFRNIFPFDTGKPYESYLRLISRFGLLRLMLAAQCNTADALPDAHALVRTVQVHCRRFEHDLGFARQVNEALVASGWARLDKVYSFLRT